ncbi:MAG TPA: hypothetical protein VFH73_21115 [Polyangia bacterium]|nr:hypothetical protein [Polyangia bacterium]
MAEESVAAVSGESPLRRHLAWLLVCLAYVYVFPYYERLNNPNENVRIWATRAVVEHGVLNIDQVSREWGWVNDKAIAGKRLYSSKAPGTSFVGVPVLFLHTKLRHLAGWPSPGKRATTFWLRLCTVELPLCIFLWFFAGYIERITRSAVARDLLVVALGVGTLFYPYGVIFVGHSQAAALAFSGYMLLSAGANASESSVAAGRSRPWASKTLAWAGFLTGLSVMFEYQALLLAGVLAAYAAVRHRARVVSFVAGAVPPGIALGAYHTALFGRPWTFPYAAIENPEFLRTGHSEGFHGLSIPKLPAIGQFLFASDYGLLVFSPVLFIGAACAVYAAVRGPRREGVLIVAVCVVMFLFLSGMSNWRAGWCVGPRYITTVAPFLVAGVAHAWSKVRASFALSALTAGLLIPSVTLNALSAAVYPHYPVQFNNPVFDLTLPLLGDGFIPYSLGQVLHLPGLWSLAPLAVALVVAVSLGASGSDVRPGRWAWHSGMAVMIAAVFLLPLSRYGRRPDPGEAQATALVRSLWEPPPVAGARK